MTVKDIIEALGKDTIRKEFDVSDKTIWAVGDANEFPAKWYAKMDALCVAAKIPLPRALFSFKPKVAA